MFLSDHRVLSAYICSLFSLSLAECKWRQTQNVRSLLRLKRLVSSSALTSKKQLNKREKEKKGRRKKKKILRKYQNWDSEKRFQSARLCRVVSFVYLVMHGTGTRGSGITPDRLPGLLPHVCIGSAVRRGWMLITIAFRSASMLQSLNVVHVPCQYKTLLMNVLHFDGDESLTWPNPNQWGKCSQKIRNDGKSYILLYLFLFKMTG